MGFIRVRLGAALAGLLNCQSAGSELSLPAPEPCTLKELLLRLERAAPGALIEPRTGELRRHIHVYLNGELVSRLETEVVGGDTVEVHLRMIEGG